MTAGRDMRFAMDADRDLCVDLFDGMPKVIQDWIWEEWLPSVVGGLRKSVSYAAYS